MAYIRAGTVPNDIAAAAFALLEAQDRSGAATPEQLFAVLGTAATVAVPNAAVRVTDPDAAAALIAAIAETDGVAVTADQIAAGLRTAGIYHRSPPPVLRRGR